MIQQPCPKCGRLLTLPDRYAGTGHLCSHCSQFLDPAPQTNPERRPAPIAPDEPAGVPILEDELEPCAAEGIPELRLAVPLPQEAQAVAFPTALVFPGHPANLPAAPAQAPPVARPVALPASHPGKQSEPAQPARPKKKGGRKRRRGRGGVLPWVVLAVVATVLLAAGLPTFWFNAGTLFLTFALVGLGVAFVMVMVLMWRWVTFHIAAGQLSSRALWVWLAALGFGVLFLGAGLTTHLAFAQATIHVENFSEHDVHLELNGQRWQSALKGSTATTLLRRGKYELVVREAGTGEELDRIRVEVNGGGDYVCNVLAAQVYSRGTAQYGAGTNIDLQDPERRIQEKWFRADVQLFFEEPPSTVTGSWIGGGRAARSYLVRREPRPNP